MKNTLDIDLLLDTQIKDDNVTRVRVTSTFYMIGTKQEYVDIEVSRRGRPVSITTGLQQYSSYPFDKTYFEESKINLKSRIKLLTFIRKHVKLTKRNDKLAKRTAIQHGIKENIKSLRSIIHEE